MHTESKELRASAMEEVEKLLRDGFPIQAYAHIKAAGLGEPHEWKDVDEQILAGRLLTPLGASRRSDVLHYQAFRQHRENGKASLYYAFGLASRFGVLRALPHIRWSLESLEMDDPTRADMIALRGYLHGTMRDFSVAYADLDEAMRLTPDRPWLWVEQAAVLRMEDRYDEALEAAEHALKLRPFYRSAVERAADLYYISNRDDKAIELLEEAAEKSEVSYIVGRLSAYYSELEEIDKTLDALDRYEALTPLAEKHVTKWLARRRSDLLYLKGDLPAVIDLAEASDSKYHKRIAKRLEAGKHADGKRVKLPVGFVRQHEMTCAPATLSAIAAFWGKDADHLDLAEEICYDGTPGHSERNWAETNGFLVREFRVDWDVTVALIDRGVPFTLTTVEPTSAHLQALIGYDAQIGILLIRDPTHKHLQEFTAESFFEDYKSSGPRGMVFVPEDRAELLDGIEFPEVELYDKQHALNRALVAHDRETAAKQFAEMEALAPGQRMTVSAQRALASYDADTLQIVAAIDRQIELYPDNQGFALAKFNNMRGLWSWEEKCEFVRAQLAKKKSSSVYLRELGELLADDARYYGEALYFLRRGHSALPRDADLLHSMAGVFWDQLKREEATELYRFATCLEPTWEYLADSYFKATRFLSRGDEGLAFLKARFDKLGGKSPLPAMTLYSAYSALSRIGEGLEMLEEALLKRPDDGKLMLYMSAKSSAYNRRERAGELLEAARDKTSENAWLRQAASQAMRHGEVEEAQRLWQEVVERQPLSIDAQRSLVQILAETQGLSKALEYLKALSERFPQNVPIHELYVAWLKDEGPASAEPAIRSLLEQSPTNNWARRELVLCLNRQGRFDEALEAAELMVEAAPNETYSHSIRGHVYEAKGDDRSAADCFRKAIEISADNSNAIRSLVDVSKSDGERREALALVAGEFKRQVIFGESISSFRSTAYPILEPEELLESMREIHRERPDLWQSWSGLSDQLSALGDGAAALEVAEGMVERFPLLPRSYLELAEVHESKGDVPAAIAALRKALDVNPNWTYAMRELGRLLQREGEFQQACEVFQKAAVIDPLEGPNFGFLGEVQWTMGEREAGFESMSEAVAKESNYGWGWEKLAEYASELEREDDALSLAQKLVDSRPQERFAWETLSDMLGSFGRREEQLKALDQGIERHPRTIDFYDAKALALAQLDRFDEAVAACRPEVFEDRPRTLRGREAWLLWVRGDKAEAIESMESLVESEPDYYWAIKTLCDWFAEEEAHEKALIWAPKLVRLAPEDAVAHGYIGHALECSDRKDEACDSYVRALQIDPTYVFAGYHLFDLQIEKEQLDAAEETLSILRVHMDNRFTKGRETLLLANQGKFDEAFEVHAKIGADPEVSEATLRWIDEQLDEMTDVPRVTLRYEQMVQKGSASKATVARWISRAVDAGFVTVNTRIPVVLPTENEFREAAWIAYFEAMAQRTEPGSEKAQLAIDQHRQELWASTATWEQVGYYYVSEFRYREAVTWLAGWEQRDDLCQWVLAQLATALESSKGLDKGVEVRRWAVAKLEPDHTDSLHRAMLAFAVADVEGSGEYEQFIEKIDDSSLNGYFEFILEMAQVKWFLSSGRRDLATASRAYARGMQAHKTWFGWRVLTRVHNQLMVKCFFKTLPSMLSMKMLWKTVRSLCESGKR